MGLQQERDRRRVRRFQAPVQARLFRSGDGTGTACALRDLSPGGAALACENPPGGDRFILYLDRIGRLEARKVAHEDGLLHLEFLCAEEKRGQIATLLGRYLRDGVARLTRLRREARLATHGLFFVRADGTAVPCDAEDISLRGIRLKTDVKPPVGEFILLGQARGRVVRHHEDGIAVQFVAEGGAAVVRFPGPRGGTSRHLDRLV